MVNGTALSDSVRARLEQLLDEAPPRRAAESESQTSRACVTRRPWGRRQVGVVALVLALGVLLAGWTVLSARAVVVPEPSALEPLEPTAVSAPSTPTASPTPPSSVVVHVLGCVVSPGVVRLPAGSRVQAALEAAGGLSREADPGELNLAAVLVDGSQIVVGRRGQPRGEVRVSEVQPRDGGLVRKKAVVGAKVDLNTASLQELDALPGVGPVTAQRILDWRSQHGRFERVGQLQEVEGIGPKTYASLQELVCV